MNVRGNDGSPPRHFAAHQLRLELLALGDVFHLLGNHSEPRQVHLRHIPVAIGTCLGRFPLLNPAIAQRHVFPLKNGPHRVESVPFLVNRNYVTRDHIPQPVAGPRQTAAAANPASRPTRFPVPIAPICTAYSLLWISNEYGTGYFTGYFT